MTPYPRLASLCRLFLCSPESNKWMAPAAFVKGGTRSYSSAQGIAEQKILRQNGTCCMCGDLIPQYMLFYVLKRHLSMDEMVERGSVIRAVNFQGTMKILFRC